jgi:hypothetical protein
VRERGGFVPHVRRAVAAAAHAAAGDRHVLNYCQANGAVWPRCRRPRSCSSAMGHGEVKNRPSQLFWERAVSRERLFLSARVDLSYNNAVSALGFIRGGFQLTTTNDGSFATTFAGGGGAVRGARTHVGARDGSHAPGTGDTTHPRRNETISLHLMGELMLLPLGSG